MIFLVIFGLSAAAAVARFLYTNVWVECGIFGRIVLCIWGPIAIVIGGGVGMLVGSGIALLVGNQMAGHWSETQTYDLASLHSNDGVAGHFFLGSGNLEGQTYYVFNTVTANGGIVPNRLQVDPSNTIVYENQPTKDPRELVFGWELDNPNASWIAMTNGTRYEFHVPPGTVQRNFVIQ